MNSLTASYDQGLRSYMIGVYNWMAIGLAVTFGIAWQMIATGAAAAIAHSGLFIVIALAPLALVFGIAFARNNAPLAAGLFLALTACIGVSMSAILIHYTLTSILTTFLATSASFAGLSLWGYTTKSDMSGLRTFFVAALFGLIALMVINIFIVSAGLHLLISIAGVLLFAALIAFDTQSIKNLYLSGYGTKVSSIQGALSLYLDFINLFQFLLELGGDRS